VLGRHGLVGLERWTRAQNASSRSPERHVPGLDEARPSGIGGGSMLLLGPAATALLDAGVGALGLLLGLLLGAGGVAGGGSA
jgi:hypothetical protein